MQRRPVAFRHPVSLVASWHLRSRPPLPHILYTAAGIVFILVAYLRDLGRNPYGFFCDEAMIGVRAQQLLDGNGQVDRLSFFYNHFDTVAGSITIYATAPFVWLFGLDEFAVRFTSVFFMLVTFLVLWRTFRLLNVRHPWLPVLIYALTPLTIHISRINFGHAPSIFLLASGYYVYLRSQRTPNAILAIAGGALIGLSAYGYPGFYAATPLFVVLIVACDVIAVRRDRRKWLIPMFFGLAALIVYLPIIQEARNNPAFENRFEAKDTAGFGLVSLDRAESMIENYPKYYNREFLFETGDTSGIQRHSVTGAGLMSLPLLPLLVLGVLGFAWSPSRLSKRAFAPFVALVFCAPLPDLLTTQTGQQAYTFSLFTASLLVPFVTAFALETLADFRDSLGTRTRAEIAGSGDHPFNPLVPVLRRVVSTPVITTVIVAVGFFFVFSVYPQYPLTSSGFWGWQAGPRDSIQYFIEHQNEYDQFYLQGVFNGPEPFLPFYIHNPELLARAHIGDQYMYQPGTRQIFVIAPDNYTANIDPNEWNLVTTITYPDNSIALYLITHK